MEIIDPNNIKQMARSKAKEVLQMSNSFKTLPYDDQFSMYKSLVDEYTNKLNQTHGIATQSSFNTSNAMAQKGPGANMGFKDYDPGFDASVDAFEDLVDSVDFPQFVADLLKAVFDSNLKVMKEQTDSYIKLMKEATKSTADFVKKVGDADAFARLAETKGDMYNMKMGANGELELTDPNGDRMDPEEAQVQMHLMDAKIAMAKEHRAALREVLLMGVTRLVVEKGEIEASVLFEITAKRKSDKNNKNTNINNNTVSGSISPPLFGLFGGPSGSFSNTNTNINVSSSNKTADDTMNAKLAGKVNIKFKTDYFKMDNFANMYADGGVAALKPATAGAVPSAPAAR
jgi:hypothetical protein